MASSHNVNLSSAVWVRSKHSSAQGNNCVELTRKDGAYAVRDSKHLDGPLLTFERKEWGAFIDNAKTGKFDRM